MYLLLSIILSIIYFISQAAVAFGVYMQDVGHNIVTANDLKLLCANETEWLSGSKSIIRKGEQLYYIVGSARKSFRYKHDKINDKNGDLIPVYYGRDKYGESGLVDSLGRLRYTTMEMQCDKILTDCNTTDNER